MSTNKKFYKGNGSNEINIDLQVKCPHCGGYLYYWEVNHYIMGKHHCMVACYRCGRILEHGIKLRQIENVRKKYGIEGENFSAPGKEPQKEITPQEAQKINQLRSTCVLCGAELKIVPMITSIAKTCKCIDEKLKSAPVAQ